MEGQIKNFYDLNAWKKSRMLVLKIYKITINFPSNEMFGIISQLRRAVCSISANLAEGFARYHFKDKIKFYYQARGSLAEVQSFLVLALDLKYINMKTCKELGELANEVNRLINGLISSARKNCSNK